MKSSIKLFTPCHSRCGVNQRRCEVGIEFFEQVLREFPPWVAYPMVIFLGILLVIWLLLPLWVLFIQWNTGKIKDEIRNLADQLEKREWDGKGKETARPKD
jgi:hypothetical protein